MTRTTLILTAVLIGGAGLAPSLPGQGHGPAYGLSTPTLGKGGWSLDVAVMDRVVGRKNMTMVRSMLRYGITEDLQVSVSLARAAREGAVTVEGRVSEARGNAGGPVVLEVRGFGPAGPSRGQVDRR